MENASFILLILILLGYSSETHLGICSLLALQNTLFFKRTMENFLPLRFRKHRFLELGVGHMYPDTQLLYSIVRARLKNC